MTNEHPTARANERASDQWHAELRALALQAMRDEEYRDKVREGRIRVLRPIHTSN